MRYRVATRRIKSLEFAVDSRSFLRTPSYCLLVAYSIVILEVNDDSLCFVGTYLLYLFQKSRTPHVAANVGFSAVRAGK